MGDLSRPANGVDHPQILLAHSHREAVVKEPEEDIPGGIVVRVMAELAVLTVVIVIIIIIGLLNQ